MAVLLHDVLDPRDSSWRDWSDRLVEVMFKTSVPPMPPDDPAGWREWADSLYEDKAFQQYGIPRPDAFDTWQEWATWVKGTFW